MEERFAGFGVLREQGPERVADSALADRAAIARELRIQRAQQRKRDERER
jgi:hypothetical protein